MEKNNVLTLIITLIVGIILAGSLLMPVLTDATTTERTFTNDGYFRMDKVTDGNLTFNWDYDEPTKIVVNDETIEYTNDSGNEISVVCSNTFYLRIRDNNASFIYNGPGGNVIADSTGESLTVTITENSGTVTNGTDTKNFTNVGDIYHISNSGDYAMKKSNEAAYLNEDSEIFIRGMSRIGIHYVSFIVNGNINDGATVLGSDVTISDISMNATADNAYKDLYKFNDITFDAVFTGETTPTHVTYNYVVVPYQVTSELSQHLTPGQISLLGAIPVMVIVALLMAAVGAIALRRAD